VNPEIHYSEIATYLKCKKNHELSYIKRIEPRVQHDAISFGTFGHKALEVLINTGGDALAAKDAVDDLWFEMDKNIMEAEQREAARELANDATFVGVRAYNWLNGRLVTVTHAGERLVEKHLRFTAEGIDFIGTPDWVVHDTQDGGNWVVDHKFRKIFRDGWSEELNLQMIFYQGLLRKSIGFDTIGTKQFQIRPFAPKQPKITEKGKISKADLMTTWEVYSKFVISRGEDPNDFLDMKTKLNKHTWFDLDGTRTYRDPSEVETIWNEVIIPTAIDIVKQRQKPTRCYDYMTCRNCSLKDYCVAETKGADLDFLMATKYKVKGEKIKQFEIEFEEENDSTDPEQEEQAVY
jgi:hypothetical protein